MQVGAHLGFHINISVLVPVSASLLRIMHHAAVQNRQQPHGRCKSAHSSKAARTNMLCLNNHMYCMTVLWF
jgi:hypothetical protein